MKKKKYLSLYYKWLKTGKLPGGFGLCYEFYSYGKDEVHRDIKRFEPIDFHYATCYKQPGSEYWASGTDDPSLGRFTPLRQTIILLMAAYNNEL